VKPRALCLLTLFLVLSCLLAPAQNRRKKLPDAPASAEKHIPILKLPNAPEKLRTDPVQLQRNAKELSDLAQSVPADIDHVNQGLLPKEIIDKLKRIEKLSKHLRGQLAP